MNILQLEYFMKLAEVGSFRKTAEELYVSQPAVSKQISLLEKEWGFDLFVRGYRTAKLTESGEIMMAMLKSANQSYEEAIYNARIKSKKYASEIKIGLPECADLGNLHHILAEFNALHPDVVLRVEYVPLQYLELDYPDGRFDLIVNYDRGLRGKNAVESVVIGKRQHYAIVSPELPAIKGIDHPTFESLKNTRVYVPSPAGTILTRDYMIYICNMNGITPVDVELLPNIESVLMAVKMCLGFAVLDDLVDIPPRFDLMKIPSNVYFDLMLAWHKDNKRPVLKSLIEKIQSELVLDTFKDREPNEEDMFLLK